MDETRQIPGWPGYYATTGGQIIGKRSKEPLQQTLSKSGNYPTVTVYKDGKTYVKRVHYFLLITFVGPRPTGYCCRHLDGNSQNNDLDNICWGTYKENTQDAVDHGTFQRGERNGKAKLTDDTVREIRQLYTTGNYSQRQLARLFNIGKSTIGAVTLHQAWEHIQ